MNSGNAFGFGVFVFVLATFVFAITSARYDAKFESAVRAKCLTQCEEKWIIVDVKPDWVGSSCRCAAPDSERK